MNQSNYPYDTNAEKNSSRGVRFRLDLVNFTAPDTQSKLIIGNPEIMYEEAVPATPQPVATSTSAAHNVIPAQPAETPAPQTTTAVRGPSVQEQFRLDAQQKVAEALRDGQISS